MEVCLSTTTWLASIATSIRTRPGAVGLIGWILVEFHLSGIEINAFSYPYLGDVEVGEGLAGDRTLPPRYRTTRTPS